MEIEFYWHIMTDAWKLLKKYYDQAVSTNAAMDEKAWKWWLEQLTPEANSMTEKYNNPFCKKIVLAVMGALEAEGKR